MSKIKIDGQDISPLLAYRSLIGIYFLLHDGEVVYVGQSINVAGRVLSHKDKVFDQVLFVPCKEKELLHVESGWIARLRPKYNKCVRAKSSRWDETVKGNLINNRLKG